MYTRRSLVLGLLAAGLLAAQDAPPTIQVTGAVSAARSVRMLTKLEVVPLRK